MTVGETLTEARFQAGLSVDELSERTRIRGTVIRSIEQDDYGACGGDLYVRGYVRALAGAVGIDAQPLIREYDIGRASLHTTRLDLPTVREDPATTAYDLPRVPEVPPAASVPPAAAQPPGTAETRFDIPVVPQEPVAVGHDPAPADSAESDLVASVTDTLGADPAGPQAADTPPAPAAEVTSRDVTAEEITAQDATAQDGTAQDGTGREADGRTSAARQKRRGLFVAAAAVFLVAAGTIGITLATGSISTRNTAATSVPSASASSAAAARASAAASVSAAAQASASAAAKASQAAAAQAQRVTSLPIASAAAYGPDGFANGDDPGGAGNAIARNPSQPWVTQWYATPTFGMLKHGTGLLLDLGGNVTVTSVRLDLNQDQGADVQVLAGNGTTLQDLHVTGTADNVGGAVTLPVRHPVADRYLLIWFTQLPSDGSGHYAESVSHVALVGRR